VIARDRVIGKAPGEGGPVLISDLIALGNFVCHNERRLTRKQMASMLERVRKSTTFLLAVFLWLHALFFLPVQPALITRLAQGLRLTPSEIVLFVLLVIFSFLAASGFWRTVGSIAYIYGFPFVLVGYTFWWAFRIIRATNRWLLSQAPSPPIVRSIVFVPTPAPIVSESVQLEVSPDTTKQKAADIWRFLLRPFRRFMLLWCILLLVTTHRTVIWLCLAVVLIQLARLIFLILRFLLFSPQLREILNKIGPALVTPIDNALTALKNVTRDVAPNNELRNLLNQLNIWRTMLDFLKNPYLVSRWGWIFGSVFFGVVYTYISFLFSFAYYGIARVSGIPYSWPDAFVTSIFFPFFFLDLPRTLGIKLLSGIHCVLLLGISIGTVVSFFTRKLDDIRRAATEVSDRFAEQTIQEKYTILQEMFVTKAVPTPEEAKETGAQRH